MNKILFGALIAVLSSSGLAQQHLLGNYSGHYVVGAGTAMGLSLDLSKVDGDTLFWGTAVRTGTVARPPCNGKYVVVGKLNGDTLVLRSREKGGPTSECDMVLRLKVQGGRLVGTMNGNKAQLRR